MINHNNKDLLLQCRAEDLYKIIKHEDTEWLVGVYSLKEAVE